MREPWEDEMAYTAECEREYEWWLENEAHTCEICGKKIETDHYYEIRGDYYCEDCIDDCRFETF